MRDRNSVLISGYAKLPASITAETVYNFLAVVVVFDMRTGTILEAEASMVTELSKRFIAELLVGYNLNDGPEELMAAFECHYHGNAKRALETAMRMVFARYQEFLESRKAEQ